MERKTQNPRWNRLSSHEYKLNILEGALIAFCSVYRKKRSAYELKLVSDNETIAQVTYYPEQGSISGLREDIRRLSRYAHLIDDVPGLPETKRQGLYSLIEELEESLPKNKS